MDTFAPYFIVLSINIFLNSSSSNTGPIMLISKRFNMMFEEFISSTTGFEMSECVAALSNDVIKRPAMLPIHIRVSEMAM